MCALWVPKIAVVTLQTFYLGKHDLLTVYPGKLDFLSVADFSPGNLPRGNFIVWVLDMSRKAKQWLWENEILRLLANRRSSAKVLTTERDIDLSVKEILRARVVYVFAFLHLAR